MLRWSLARSINIGMINVRVFRREISKYISGRKSTIDVKPRLLIKPGSEEFKTLALNDSRRSRSAATLDDSSDDNSDSETI